MQKMMNYAHVKPDYNKVASGYLIMNQAKADRCAQNLSRQNSIASHTATISNDVDQDEDRDLVEMRPQALFFQDSLIPRPRSARNQDVIVD